MGWGSDDVAVGVWLQEKESIAIIEASKTIVFFMKRMFCGTKNTDLKLLLLQYNTSVSFLSRFSG